MRRLFAGLALAGLILAGCSSPTVTATPTPVASPSSTPSPAPSPTPSPSASATPAIGSPPPVTGLGCRAAVQPGGTPVSGSGPHNTKLSTGSAAVALTFDDGPDPVNTPKILDLLKQCGVKATFCVNGIKVAPAESVIRRIHQEGHTFCNHTWRHIRQLGSYGRELIRQDLAATNDAIRVIVPGAKISYFRAPGGQWTADYVAVAKELGMTSLHWHVDTSDWKTSAHGQGRSMVNHIIATVKSETRPGSVILAHDYQKPDTTEALRTLLPWLKSNFALIALPPDGLS